MFPLAAAFVLLSSQCDSSRDRPGIREHHPVCYVIEDQDTPFMANHTGAGPRLRRPIEADQLPGLVPPPKL